MECEWWVTITTVDEFIFHFLGNIALIPNFPKKIDKENGFCYCIKNKTNSEKAFSFLQQLCILGQGQDVNVYDFNFFYYHYHAQHSTGSHDAGKPDNCNNWLR